MKTMIKRGSVAVAAAVLVLATGCSFTPTAQDKENQQQQAAANDMINAQPVPSFPFSVMRQNLSEIRTFEAQGGPTTSFEFQGTQGQPPVRQCASVGMPIPGNTSLSNPHQVVNAQNNNTWSNEVLDQMEPTGVYPSASTQGTYVMCIRPDGSVAPSYWEGNVQTEVGAAHWDDATHQIVTTGAPGFHFSRSCTMRGNVPVCS